jgi:hypothetical protein
MKFFIFLCFLLGATNIYAEDTCATSNFTLTALKTEWQVSKFPSVHEIKDDKTLFSVELISLENAKKQYGEITIKSKKHIIALGQIDWLNVAEGEYWIAADSGVWIDVVNKISGVSLEPLEIERTLRCVGIHKALRFSLTAGDFVLVIASEQLKPVKIALQRITN